MPKPSEETLAGWRARLSGGIDPHIQGAADGRLNYPATDGTEPAPYQQAVIHNAWEAAHELEARAQAEVQEHLGQVRDNPFALPGAGPEGRCRSMTADTLMLMDNRLKEDHHHLTEARKQKEARERDREHDFLVAGETPPPGGWLTIWQFVNLLLLVLAIDSGAAYLVLQDKLGAREAVWAGVSVPFITMVLGMAAALLWLRPKLKSGRRTTAVLVKRAAAVILVLAASAYVYAVAAYRSCLEDGLSATGSEIFQRFFQPEEVFAFPETSALLLAGLVGLAVAFWKVESFFRGMSPSLRDCDLAFRNAVTALIEEHSKVVTYVTGAADEGLGKLDEMLAAGRAWAKATVNFAELATAIVLEMNHTLAVVNRAVDGLDRDYRRANEQVRTAPAPRWIDLPGIGEPLAVPDAFALAREQAVKTTLAWTSNSDAAKAEISAAKGDALVFLDRLAGFEPLDPPPSAHVAALVWRTER